MCEGLRVEVDRGGGGYIGERWEERGIELYRQILWTPKGRKRRIETRIYLGR